MMKLACKVCDNELGFRYEFLETDSLDEIRGFVNALGFQNIVIDWDDIDYIPGADGLVRPFNDLVDDIL